MTIPQITSRWRKRLALCFQGRTVLSYPRVVIDIHTYVYIHIYIYIYMYIIAMYDYDYNHGGSDLNSGVKKELSGHIYTYVYIYV